MVTTVDGAPGSQTITAPSGNGTSYKYDGKAGNDVIKGSTGNDIVIGGAGSDFQFNKFANSGDHDYVVDFAMGVDTLSIFNGATIKAANYFHDTTGSMNGQGLANDAKVFDLLLTLHVVDGAKEFDYQVTLLDVVKNTTWSANQVEDFLESLGYFGGLVFGEPTTPV